MPSLKYEGFNAYPGVMNHQVPSDFILNPISFGPYKATYQTFSSQLTAGTQVSEDVPVSFIGNNTLLESSFTLRELDRRPIETVMTPGKSAHISHTQNCALAVLTMLGRKAKREDNLYTVTAGQLTEIGLSPIYAPTPKKLLHVRVVPDEFDEDGDIPADRRKELVYLLQENKISKANEQLVFTPDMLT